MIAECDFHVLNSIAVESNLDVKIKGMSHNTTWADRSRNRIDLST